MKKYNKILEAIQKGINIALDDFEDKEIQSQKISRVKDKNLTKDILDFQSCFIDMGLPSGTKWFAYNLGCDWKKLLNNSSNIRPRDWYGDYYAWGEIYPKQKYSKETYNRHSRPGEYIITKYLAGHGNDNLYELELKDDAAFIENSDFIIPSVKQMKELIDNSVIRWEKNYNNIIGLFGIVLKSKINDKELFFPAAGYRNYYEATIEGKPEICDYHSLNYAIYIWLSSISLDEPYMANCWVIGEYECRNKLPNDVHGSLSKFPRLCGFSIRPVLNKND